MFKVLLQVAAQLPWWIWVVLVIGGASSIYEGERRRERKLAYREYLRSPGWRQTRREALDRARHRCQDCGRKTRSLHVHHRTYERLGHEAPRDLRVLCASCHARRHSPNRGLLDDLADRLLD